MDKAHKSFLRKLAGAAFPVQFEGSQALLAAEAIDLAWAEGDTIPGEDGVVRFAVLTRLTGQGRVALHEATVRFRLERLFDMLIGVVTGVVTTVASALLLRWL